MTGVSEPRARTRTVMVSVVASVAAIRIDGMSGMAARVWERLHSRGVLSTLRRHDSLVRLCEQCRVHPHEPRVWPAFPPHLALRAAVDADDVCREVERVHQPVGLATVVAEEARSDAVEPDRHPFPLEARDLHRIEAARYADLHRRRALGVQPRADGAHELGHDAVQPLVAMRGGALLERAIDELLARVDAHAPEPALAELLPHRPRDGARSRHRVVVVVDEADDADRGFLREHVPGEGDR